MPSSYSVSARFTLQATGENNNTWGVILNQGVFQLVDDAICGRLSVVLTGDYALTTANGAPDEARMAFLDVSGVGATITLPAAPKGYFVHNFASGPVTISAGASSSAVYQPGDAFPCFSDGSTVYGVSLGYQPIRQYIDAADQQIINYINTAITSGSLDLPPPQGNGGKALIVRGAAPHEAWVPDFLLQSDVVGLTATLATLTANDTAQAANAVLARAFYGDLF